ncbi:T6SS phospholipase effector Tle1-like catalytic domain-containing protein, partial [Xanthomonas albilineans]
MSNERADAKTWPDDVETYPATAQDLAAYAHSRHALAQFQAPLLISQQNPHTRLFVACFDGTGNDKNKDPQHITNIGILYDQVQTAAKKGFENIGGYYVPGVGTQDDALTRIADGALGYSYGPRMEEMYFKFIDQAKKWHDEDPQAEISIVSTGFSRGAVTAAMFTRMVHERGIQDRKDMYIDRDSHGQILKLTPRHPPLVPPGRTAQTVGLLDPVATGEMNLHDVRLPPSVVSGLQLTARDERRDLFPAKDILHPGHSHDGRFLNLTHPGAHSDIGGSYRLDGLSVRNGNLLTDYVNSLSDKPFLQPRTVSSAPEMNVIHRSEQHGSYYTTTMATTLGHRVHVHNLDGTGMTQAPNDAQSLDAGLRAHLPLRPVAVSTERTDPALPAFFRERPHALATPPLPAHSQQGTPPHARGASSTHTTSTNADASSTLPPAMDRHMQEHAPPTQLAAERATTGEAPPRAHSPEYLAASATLQRIAVALENNDRETLRKE